MHSWLRTYCTRLIEAGWLIAVAVVPLYFNTSTSRIFEPDKIALLRSLALVMAAAWIVKAIEHRFGRGDGRVGADGPALFRNGIVLSAMLVLIITALATVFSVLPGISLWGYSERLAGLYTTATYLFFFFAVLAHLRTQAQLQRLITAILLTSLPVALYGLVQELGTDPILWKEAIEGRARSTLGYPAALAATLALAVPLTLLRLRDTLRQGHYLLLALYLTLLILQVAVILFTRSRGPVLGLAAGLFLGGLVWTICHQWRRSSLALMGSGVVLVLFLVVINLPNSPMGFVQDLPYLNRLTKLSDPAGSTRGRALIWEGAIHLMAEKPQRLPLGYGPDTIRYVLYPYYSADLGYLHGWEAFVDRAHNETFDVLITTGLLGLLSYLLLMTALIFYGLRWLGLINSPRQRLSFLGLWTLGGLLAVGLAGVVSQTWVFSGVAVCFGLLAGLFCYLAGYQFAGPRSEEARATPYTLAWMIALLVGLVAHFVETNVGIAFSATNLLFWIYAAVLVVVGALFTPRSSDTPAKEVPSTPPARAKSDVPVLGLLVGLLMMTLAYDFARHLDTVALQSILGGTWLLAGGVLLVPTSQGRKWMGWLRNVGLYAALSLLPCLLFLWLRRNVFQQASSQLWLYVALLLGMMAGIAFFLSRQGQPAERLSSWWSFAVAAVALLGAGYVIYQINVQPILASIYHQEARTAFKQRQYDLATTSYWHALDLDPRQELYQLEYAQLLATKAHYPTPDPETRTQLYEEAERLLQVARTNNPYEQYHPAALGEVYRLWASTTPDAARREARYAQAVAAYEDALAINAENVVLWRQVAALYDELGDTARTRDAYERILSWDSTNVGMYQQLAAIHEARSEISEAIAVYERAIAQSSQPVLPLHQRLAALYEKTGRLEEATRASEQAVALGPDVPGNYVALIRLYQRQGRCAEARTQAEAALQKWPTQEALRTRYQNLLEQCKAETTPQ